MTDGEKYHVPVKSLSRLLYGLTSDHHGDFYCLGCLHSFRTDSVIKSAKVCDYCRMDMPVKYIKIFWRKIIKSSICALRRF